jgi:lauroyl/myristoyl acyltransferase
VAGAEIRREIPPVLSRKTCYRLAFLLGSLGTMVDSRGRRVALSNLRVAFGDDISRQRHNVRLV